MSYCRWSCMNFKSDVYVFANVSGAWTIMVAGNRIVDELPEVPSLTRDSNEEWMRKNAIHRAALEKAKHVPIGLPHDEEIIDTAGPQECAEKLLELRALGYVVPQYAIDSLLEEAAE